MNGQPKEAEQRVAIAVAPNGGRRTKADHPGIPLTPDEMARTASECLEAGACTIHVHVRDAQGGHLLDADAYAEMTKAIRQAVGDRLVIQITSEALGIYRPEEQMSVVRATRPEAVSLALRELAPDEASEPAFAEFLNWLRQERIVPQIILYTPEEAIQLDKLRRRGLVPFERIPVLYVLGRYTLGQTSHPADLLPFLVPRQPNFTNWMVCAFGRHEAACVTTAALLGGHVRVGFENNVFLPNGTVAGSNAELITQTARALTICGSSLADAGSWRQVWAECIG